VSIPVIKTDVAVIGGGPAGLGAAAEACAAGKKTLVLERDFELGGILQQCIHNGFGLTHFGEELTGPEYAERVMKHAMENGAEFKMNTMVLEIKADREILAVNKTDGLFRIRADAVILTMGCRERTRGAICIPGTRPAGVYTAGCAQRFVNMEGYMPGRKIVILGSGDIGLIMARRMHLEGAQVKGVYEIMPYSNGLTRNIVQCLHDYKIPLHLGRTVVEIHGKERLTGVTVADVDASLRPVPGTEEHLECDTLLLSVGLIPENELSKCAGVEMDCRTSGPVVDQFRETSIPGIYAAGNVLHVHDLVDFVTEEAELAGERAAAPSRHSADVKNYIPVLPGSGIGYVVPQKINRNGLGEKPFDLYLRVRCPDEKVTIKVVCGGEVLNSKRHPFVKPSEMIKVHIDEETQKKLAALAKGGKVQKVEVVLEGGVK